MDQEHWSIWGCPLCPSARFDTSPELSDHTLMQHVDEVPPGRREAFVRLCRTTSLERVGALCPLSCGLEAQTVDQYQDHIVKHLEEVACFAFPELFGKAENLTPTTQDSKDLLVTPRGQPSDIETSFAKLSIRTAEQTTSTGPVERGRRSVSVDNGKPRMAPPSNLPEKVASDTIAPSLQRDAASSSPLQSSAQENLQLNTPAVSSSRAESSSLGISSDLRPPQWHNQPYRTGGGCLVESHKVRGSTKPGKSHIVYLWTCCYCGHGGMNVQTTPACVNCGIVRC
jgi:hypothetical protein